MNRRFLGYAVLAVLVTTCGVYTAAQLLARRGFPESGSQKQVTIQLSLDPGEWVFNSAAGNLTGNITQPALAFATILPGYSRIRVLHRHGDHYETAWTYTDQQERVSVGVSYTHDPFRANLIISWDSGTGHVGDTQILEWNGRTYQQIWSLYQAAKENGQLGMGARISFRQMGPHGEVGLVIRAPIVESYERRHDPLPHQVSIYRWDAHKQTFVLFKRFVDPAKTLD